MSRFRLPTFIAPCSIWRFSNWGGTLPPSGSADVEAMCNLTPGRRVYEEGVHPTSYILIPKDTDIRYSESRLWTVWPPTDPDLVEVPTGSGIFYIVSDTERVGLGFANEHLEAAITKQPISSPTPPPGSWSYTAGAGFQMPDQVAGDVDIPLVLPTGPTFLTILAFNLTAGSVTALTDTGGNTWNELGTVTTNGDCNLQLFWSVAATAVVSVTATISDDATLSIAEDYYAFPGTVVSVSSADAYVGSSGLVPAGPTGPIGADLQLMYIGGQPGDVFTLTPTAPFVEASSSFDGDGSGAGPLAVMQDLNDASAENPSPTLGSSITWCAIWITFNGS